MPSRFFVLNSIESTAFREVSEKEFRLWKGHRYAFPSSGLDFKAKLVDVKTNQVLQVAQFKTAANWNLPNNYEAKLVLKDGKTWTIFDENFKYSEPWWVAGVKKDAETAIFDMIADGIKAQVGESRKAGATPATPSTGGG